VPMRRPRSSRYPIWFTQKLIKLIKEKDKVRKKYLIFNNTRDNFEFQILRERCHKLYNICYKNYIRETEQGICKSAKQFWRYIKEKRIGRSDMPSIMSLNSLSADTGGDIADLFAAHFASIYSCGNSFAGNCLDASIGCHNLSGINFTKADVLKRLKGLDESKGPGPDNVPPFFVKHCAESLALPLTLIFNSSLTTGRFPDEWKLTRIIPIFKKGDQTDVRNYRPISILSCFSKIFESLVYPVLYTHLDCIISDFQHGFRAGRSADTNLASFVSSVSLEVDKGFQVDALYTDFSSAFDKVNHKILLSKLKSSGLGPPLIDWFESYLHRRPQTVVIKGYQSKVFYAISGVPQGSHLGPVLFLLFINDVTLYIQHSKISMFADDIKIYRTVNNMLDAKLLQVDLDGIVKWCKVNDMSLNVVKCFHISYTKKKCPVLANYSLDNKKLSKVHEIRDLGVLLDSKLNFASHVDLIIKKSAKLLGFLKRNTRCFKQSHTRLVVFNAFVRSRLEYASVAWNPVYSAQSQRIESLQRAFTRHLAFVSPGINHRQPYQQRLDFFKLKTLRDRRAMSDVLFLYKLINSGACCGHLLSMISLNVPRRLPRHPCFKTFHIPRSKTNLGLHQPVSRMCAAYNALYAKTDKTVNIDIFNDGCQSFRGKLLKLIGSV
jgi:hypothetical protein